MKQRNQQSTDCFPLYQWVWRVPSLYQEVKLLLWVWIYEVILKTDFELCITCSFNDLLNIVGETIKSGLGRVKKKKREKINLKVWFEISSAGWVPPPDSYSLALWDKDSSTFREREFLFPLTSDQMFKFGQFLGKKHNNHLWLLSQKLSVDPCFVFHQFPPPSFCFIQCVSLQPTKWCWVVIL